MASLINSIKKYLRRISAKCGFYFGIDLRPKRLTPKKDLEALVKALHPIKTNFDLIRMGSKRDGGYLLIDDLIGVEALVSPGVGNKQDFDYECANLDLKVYMADKSVDGPKIMHKNFNFIKKFVASVDDESHISMENWISKMDINGDSDLILQMDIEGSEYEVIYSTPKNILNRFRIMIIEFHDMDMLWNAYFFEKFKNVFYKLLEDNYVVHIHPNNCCKSVSFKEIEIPPVMEFTFVRKDRVKCAGLETRFPHPLDQDCTTDEPLTLPKCFYKN